MKDLAINLTNNIHQCHMISRLMLEACEPGCLSGLVYLTGVEGFWTFLVLGACGHYWCWGLVDLGGVEGLWS